MLALGRLTLEGKPAQGQEPLREGQNLRFAVVDYEEPEVPIDFVILRQSPNLCLVHKPAGMPVHRTGKIFFQTLANLLRERLQDTAWSPLNRLDRETSGLVAFARGSAALRHLSPESVASSWTKLYMAVIRGSLPESGVGILDQSLTMLPDDAIRCRVHAQPGGKSALTLYQTMACKDGLSLVVLSPITGRKHQLRVHLAHAGCPVVGDKIYSGDGQAYLKRLNEELNEDDYAVLGAQNHLLHAFYLGIAWDGNNFLDAWDWGLGPDFLRHFSEETPTTWKDSGKLDEIIRQANLHRNNPKV